jgi:DNA-binding XRE family transcriptional regulator
MKKNRLKELIDAKCVKINLPKTPREKKYRAKHEMMKIAKHLGVSWWTVFAWYQNKYQPRGLNNRNLPEYFGISWKTFYYFDEN